MSKKQLPKDAWFTSMDKLCKRRTGCTWADLCGDTDPWEQAFKDGHSPEEFVSWWIEKYGLEDLG